MASANKNDLQLNFTDTFSVKNMYIGTRTKTGVPLFADANCEQKSGIQFDSKGYFNKGKYTFVRTKQNIRVDATLKYGSNEQIDLVRINKELLSFGIKNRKRIFGPDVDENWVKFAFKPFISLGKRKEEGKDDRWDSRIAFDIRCEDSKSDTTSRPRFITNVSGDELGVHDLMGQRWNTLVVKIVGIYIKEKMWGLSKEVMEIVIDDPRVFENVKRLSRGDTNPNPAKRSKK
jgi:hypothetical protein